IATGCGQRTRRAPALVCLVVAADPEGDPLFQAGPHAKVCINAHTRTKGRASHRDGFLDRHRIVRSVGAAKRPDPDTYEPLRYDERGQGRCERIDSMDLVAPPIEARGLFSRLAYLTHISMTLTKRFMMPGTSLIATGLPSLILTR